MESTLDPDLINEIFKRVWRKTAAGLLPYMVIIITNFRLFQLLPCFFASAKRDRNDFADNLDIENTEVVAAAPKKNRPASANAKAVKLSCELLRLFVTEAIQRSAMIAEAEGATTVEATHLERILPQLLLDF